MMTLGSLFDGSGGFTLGGILAGIEPKWASEVEPFPIRVTTKRLPSVKHLGDIHRIHGDEIEPVDIITFGSPCTNLSIAGWREGLHGQESILFFEAIRIVREMRRGTDGKYPRFIVWENVAGAFSSAEGRDFQSVLTEIVRIKEPEAPEVPLPQKGGWAYVPKEEMDRKIAELKKFSNDTYEMQLRTVQEEMQEKLHVAEVRSAATVEEKETEKQRIIAQHHKLIQQMKSERNNALAEVTQNYETMIRAKNEEITALRSKLSAREEDLRAANARIETLNADITAFSARSRKEAEDLSYVEKEQYVEELMKLQTMLAQLEREKTAQDRYTAELEELIQSQDAKTEQERAAHEAELQKLRDERADSDAKLAKTRQSLAQASKDKEEIESLYLESKKKLEEMRKDVDYRTDETRTDILETLDILKVFRESVQNAKAELNIFSPWLNDDVIYKTSFKTDIEKLLKAGVKVKIRYGIGEEGEKKKNQKDDWKQRRSEEIAKELKQAFQKYRHFSMFRDNAHAKLFICDDEYYVITSFNVLSYHPRKKDTRREIGEMSRNLENLREYRQMYFSDEDFR